MGDNDRQNHLLFPWDMFSTPSTNQTRSCQQPTTGLGRWATAQESASLYTHVHTIPCSGVRPPQTPEQTRDHATVETETHYIYNLYNIILVNYIIYIYIYVQYTVSITDEVGSNGHHRATIFIAQLLWSGDTATLVQPHAVLVAPVPGAF